MLIYAQQEMLALYRAMLSSRVTNNVPVLHKHLRCDTSTCTYAALQHRHAHRLQLRNAKALHAGIQEMHTSSGLGLCHEGGCSWSAASRLS